MGLTSSKHDPLIFYEYIDESKPPTIPIHPIHVSLYVNKKNFFSESHKEDSWFNKILNKKLPLTSWVTHSSSLVHPSNGIVIQKKISQFMSPRRPWLNTMPHALVSNIATVFLSWIHTAQNTLSTPYPILTLTTMASPNTSPPTSTSAYWLTGLSYWPSLTPLLTCPSSLPTKGH